MKREIFDPEHLAFRETVQQFLARHVLPHHASWEQAGMVDRWVWKAAADQGLLGLQAEEQYGGGGIDDFRFNMAYLDSRVETIFGGTTEIMKEIIGRSVGL
jgi:alkylation response protein AidB-like acyl-CoA dehydrogenase